ncbi:hypothetical protein FJ527_25565 [Mesorhizobium sp. B2-4-18]|uniref:hypothetical protein n=1 Tax=Mesorhizobium sp. B2-4-18 TaxID=2589931 RepID=UPI00112BBFA5|nr:hypothetical protein [Mesorhizobium sp. B2-4-18]TPK71912.1 hypothetical protein FJ527_25565 [Mesorhizobium sp. B2-4-18]
MCNAKASLLLIDDNEPNLAALRQRLVALLHPEEADLHTWVPTENDGPPAEAFEARVDENTALVITDYDLTTSVRGLFGLSIVGWCQKKSIPVGDFSRGNVTALPKEPNLFELRVPTDDEHDAAFIATMFRGFRAIRQGIEHSPALLTERRSLAAVLASLLGRPRLESQFAAYMSRLGAANSALLQRLRDFAGDEEPNDADKIRLLTYVLGHVLFNAVLKYPGPILSRKALCAYVATGPEEGPAIEPYFADARYLGPFSEGQSLFWKEEVDSILDRLGADLGEAQFESFADLNRHIMETVLGRQLLRHQCDRCGGVKGGFWCPFTLRPVCERSDCSVPSSSWIPTGAQLSRVEKDFYDEWAPLLGL